MREEDVLADGFILVAAKTRRRKHGWLPEDLHAELQACAADGWAFRRFSDELRRLLMLWKKRPHHAAKVREFSPKRLVGWIQDELKRFCDAREGERFTLHDFRRTAITGMQMAGVSEKETSVMIGATPEVIRRHYEKLDQRVIARRNVQRRLGAAGSGAIAQIFARPLRAAEKRSIDIDPKLPQTVTA